MSEQEQTTPPGTRPQAQTDPRSQAAPQAPPEERPEPPPEEQVQAEAGAPSPSPQGPSSHPDPAESEDRWRRALADLDNLRKRYARDRPRELEAERAKATAAWLPVVDNLERALAHAGDDSGPLVKGVEAVRDQAVEILRSLGYPRHDEVGVPFDPVLHDVVSVVDDPDAAPGTVVQVLLPGYGDPGRQLRPAAVAVGRRQE